MVQDKYQPESPSDGRILEFSSSQENSVVEKIETLEDAPDVSDTGDGSPAALQPELDDRDTLETHPAVEASGIEKQNGKREKRGPSIIDDCCSTCSTDSIPTVVMNGSYKDKFLPNSKSETSPIRVKNQRGKDTKDRTGSIRGDGCNTTDAVHLCDDADKYRVRQPEPKAAVLSLKDWKPRLQQHLVEKEEVVSRQNKLTIKDSVEEERPSNSWTAESSSSPSSPWKKLPSASQRPKQSSENTTTTATTPEPVSSKDPPSSSPSQTEKSATLATKTPQIPTTSTSEVRKLTTLAKSTTTHQIPAMPRALSVPLIPTPSTTAPIVSTVQTMPLLSRSISAAGRLGTDPSPSAPCYVPQSYRSSSQPVVYSQSPSAFVSTGSMPPPRTSVRSGRTSPYTFGLVKPETLQSQYRWRDDYSRRQAYDSNLASEINRFELYGDSRAKQHLDQVSSSCSSGQAQGIVSEEFPHLAIINDLLNDDQCTGKAAKSHHRSINRHYSFPRDVSTADIGGHCRFDRPEQYYSEGFETVYSSSGGPPHGLMDAHVAQMDLSAYDNGQIGGVVQNQWPYRHADLSMLNSGSVDANGYSYQLADYLNSSCGGNGYNMY